MKCIIIPKGSNCTMSLDGHDKLCGYQKSLFPTHIALESTFYKYGPLTMTLKWYEGFTWTIYMKAEVMFVNFHFRELSSCCILLSLTNLFGTYTVRYFRTTDFPFPTLCVLSGWLFLGYHLLICILCHSSWQVYVWNALLSGKWNVLKQEKGVVIILFWICTCLDQGFCIICVLGLFLKLSNYELAFVCIEYVI